MTDLPERLTLDEAYRAMFCFLEAYWQRGGGLNGGNDEIAIILGHLALHTDGQPMDPANAEDWRVAVKHALASATAADARLQEPPL